MRQRKKLYINTNFNIRRYNHYKHLYTSLAGVAQWIECWPVNQRMVVVRFPVRAHAWAAGQVPSRGHVRGNHTLMFLSFFSSSLSLSLKTNKIFFKKKYIGDLNELPFIECVLYPRYHTEF